MREIVLSELRPIGNLQEILETFEKQVIMCEGEGYTKEVARICKLLMEFGFLDANEWFDEMTSEDERPEIESIVIFPRVLLIRLNNIAQRDLNGMKMKPNAEQLMDDKDFMKYFPNTIFK